MKEFILQIFDFMKEHDFQHLLEHLRQLEWRDVLRSGYTWLVGAPLLLTFILTKRFKTLLALASLAAFVLLLQYTLPPYGETIPLSSLLEFLGGAFAIVAINLYFLLIRD